jgi:hypothetical protein
LRGTVYRGNAPARFTYRDATALDSEIGVENITDV